MSSHLKPHHDSALFVSSSQAGVIMAVCGFPIICCVPAEPAPKSVVRKESKAAGDVVDQTYDSDSRTITVTPGQAFPGDNRSSSGLGLGDGLTSHTAKWLAVGCRPATPLSMNLDLQCWHDCGHLTIKEARTALAWFLQADGSFDGNLKSPMEFIHEAPPIKVHGAVVASFGCKTPLHHVCHVCDIPACLLYLGVHTSSELPGLQLTSCLH